MNLTLIYNLINNTSFSLSLWHTLSLLLAQQIQNQIALLLCFPLPTLLLSLWDLCAWDFSRPPHCPPLQTHFRRIHGHHPPRSFHPLSYRLSPPSSECRSFLVSLEFSSFDANSPGTVRSSLALLSLHRNCHHWNRLLNFRVLHFIIFSCLWKYACRICQPERSFHRLWYCIGCE